MERTVIVVGAGLSVPYGYPSGRSLVSLIIRRWKEDKLYEEEYRKLARDLEDTAAISIDRFLSEKKSHLNTGIAAIVKELVLAELNSIGHQVEEDQDIIKTFLDEISPQHFPKVTFVSFNYDRHLEWRFFKRLKVLSPNESETEAMEQLSKLNIIHIHGRLLPFCSSEASLLKYQPNQFIGYGEVPTSTNDDAHNVTARNLAIEKFRTVYTNDEHPHPEAVLAIKNAKRVFFLGFGFDEKNMMKLGIGSGEVIYDWASKYVAGTCYRMPGIFKGRVESSFPFLKNRLYDLTDKKFFAEKFSLTDSKHDIERQKIQVRDCCTVSAIQERPKRPHDVTGYQAVVKCTDCRKDLRVYYSTEFESGRWEVRIDGKSE